MNGAVSTELPPALREPARLPPITVELPLLESLPPAEAVLDETRRSLPEDLRELAKSYAAVNATTYELAVAKLSRHRPALESALKQQGLPVELLGVALVESGGDPKALSPKSARGLWQLMPGTARDMGLVVSRRRDERIHITKATLAAGQYLRYLYDRFRDWALAFAAYNAGPTTVANAIESAGSADFRKISGLLPRETQNYVPAVFAAILSVGTSLPSGARRK